MFSISSPIVCALGRSGRGLWGPLLTCPPEELKACGIPRLFLLGVSWLWDEVLTGCGCGGGGVGGCSCSGLLGAEVGLVPFITGGESGSVRLVETTWKLMHKIQI